MVEKHKDKKSKAEKRPVASAKKPEPLQMEKVLEEMVTCIVEGSDVEGEQRLQSFLATIRKSTGWDKGLLEIMECRIRQAVEEKRRENIEDRDQVAEQEQNKKVRFAEEEQPEETQEQSTDKQDVMSGPEELRTGRGSRPLVRGGDERCQANETCGKGKGKGNGGKGEHGNKGSIGSKGTQEAQQNTKMMKGAYEDAEEEKEHEEDERVQMAPNMGAGGSHPQAMADPKEEEGAEEEKKEMRRPRWADCDDDEEVELEKEGEREDKAKGEKVSVQEEVTDEKTKGLEVNEESKHELK